MTKNLTTGSPMKLICEFAFPVLVSMLFQQFYNLVDTMIVGKFLGAEALAAVGATGSLCFMVLGFCIGMCAGFAIPMSHSFGVGDMDLLKKYIGNATWLCIAISAFMAVMTGLNCRAILELMNTPEDIIDRSYAYVSIIFWGIPTLVLYNMLSSIIRAVGDSKTPVYFLALSSVMNIVLDLVFIVPMHMGIVGAAVATVISQGVSGVLCLIYFQKKFSILLPHGIQWQPHRYQIQHLCGMGIPMGLQYSVTAIGSLVLQAAVNGLGTLYVAAVTASGKLGGLFCIPYDALGSTAATFAGQNTGAGKPHRVEQGMTASMIIGTAFSLFSLAVYYFFGAQLVGLFVDGPQEELVSLARQHLLWNAAFYIPLAAVNIYRFAIQGLGHSSVAILAGVMEMVARAGVAMLVGVWGFTAVCLASPAAWILADLFLLPTFYYYIKKEKKKYAV